MATGRSDIPYDALDTLGVQVYGMPAGVPFHSPLLYNQQQLQQILANLEKIVFLKVSPQAQQVVVRLVLSALYCPSDQVCVCVCVFWFVLVNSFGALVS